MLARSVTINAAGQAIAFPIGFATSLLLARLLGPADRGLLGIMISAGEIAMTVLALGLPMAVLYHASREETSPGALLGDALAYAGVLTAFMLPAAWFLREPLGDLLSHGRGGATWVLAAALVPLTFLAWTTRNQLVGKLRFRLANALLVVARLAMLVGVVALVGIANLGVVGALAATAVATLVSAAFAMRVLIAEERPRLDATLLRGLLRYGGRVQIGTVFQQLNYRLDVIVLQFFLPLAYVGYYVVAQILAELVIYLGVAFQTSVMPLVSHYDGDERQAAMTLQSIRHHAILALVATIAVAAFAPAILLLGYGPSYRPALEPLFILLPGMWFLGTGIVVGGDLRGRDRPGVASLLSGVAVVATIVLDLTLIPRHGVAGAAIASLVAYIVFGSASLIALSRVTGTAVRSLIVPTRADLALYPLTARRAATWLRP